jgi:hypothetical protein
MPGADYIAGATMGRLRAEAGPTARHIAAEAKRLNRDHSVGPLSLAQCAARLMVELGWSQDKAIAWSIKVCEDATAKGLRLFDEPWIAAAEEIIERAQD